MTISQLGSLIDCVDKEIISAKVGKSVLDIMVEGDRRLAVDIVNEKGWRQLDDQAQMEHWCTSIIDRYPKKVEAIRKGNIGVLGFFVGQIMKDSEGRANPVVLNQLLREKIGITSK